MRHFDSNQTVICEKSGGDQKTGSTAVGSGKLASAYMRWDGERLPLQMRTHWIEVHN